MKKAILVLSVVILVGLPLIAVGADVIKIDIAAEFFKGGKKKKAAVEFNHTKHGKDFAIACLECHHKSDEAKLKSGAEKPAQCASAKCHGPAKVDKMVDSEDAYHKNCKDCHKKDEKAKKAKAPTKCKDCHPGSTDY